MTLKHLLAAIAALATLASCVLSVPAPPPTVVEHVQKPGDVTGTDTTARAKPSLKATLAEMALAVKEERLLNTFLRDQSGVAPTSGVLWISDNTSIVKVNPLTGLATGVGPGTAVVTASLQAAPEATAQFAIKVSDKDRAVQVVIEPQSPELEVGEQVKLTAKVTLADGTINGNVDWSSSDSTIAVVNPTTGVVTAKKAGEVTIVGAYTIEPKYKGVANVKVVAPSAEAEASAEEETTATEEASASPAEETTASGTVE